MGMGKNDAVEPANPAIEEFRQEPSAAEILGAGESPSSIDQERRRSRTKEEGVSLTDVESLDGELPGSRTGARADGQGDEQRHERRGGGQANDRAAAGNTEGGERQQHQDRGKGRSRGEKRAPMNPCGDSFHAREHLGEEECGHGRRKVQGGRRESGEPRERLDRVETPEHERSDAELSGERHRDEAAGAFGQEGEGGGQRLDRKRDRQRGRVREPEAEAPELRGVDAENDEGGRAESLERRDGHLREAGYEQETERQGHSRNGRSAAAESPEPRDTGEQGRVPSPPSDPRGGERGMEEQGKHSDLEPGREEDVSEASLPD